VPLTKNCSSFVALIVLALLVVLNPSCGGGSSTPQTMTPAQAQAVSQEVLTTVQAAMNSAFTAGLSADAQAHPSLAKTVSEHFAGRAYPEQSNDCTTSSNGESCNIPISYTGDCPQGGTIGVTGDFIFTLDNSGDGSDSSSLTITPTGCEVSSLTINGNPNLTVATQFSFQSEAISYPITFTETGGITYGPKPSGSCTMNVTLTVNSATSCTVSGTACGQSVSGSC